MENNKCSCGTDENKIVLTCSGASDVGMIADQVSRALKIGGHRNMGCLAKVGAGIEKVIADIKQKDVLVIDGCPISCGKKMMEKYQIENFKYLVVTEQGLKNGSSPATPENIKKIYNEAIKL
ncbi:hypothetical protein EYV94_01610 [Puteibacter caeruleilacunae]|nr:hypothetical protein EYV94_01610 [Puteibacter caeruleilacunae]